MKWVCRQRIQGAGFLRVSLEEVEARFLPVVPVVRVVDVEVVEEMEADADLDRRLRCREEVGIVNE